VQLYTRILLGMVVGLILGVLFGPNSSLLPADGLVPGAAPIVMERGSETSARAVAGVSTVRIVQQSDGWAQVEWVVDAKQALRLQQVGESSTPGDVRQGWVEIRPEDPEQRTYSRIGQRLVDGTYWIGRLFLALIKMVVVPLVFCSLAVGIASLGDFRRLGRMGGRTLGLFMSTTVAALAIGVGLANLLRPGSYLSAEERARLLGSFSGEVGAKVDSAAAAPSLEDQLVGLVPTNPVDALASGDMLQIIVFATLFGIALTLMAEERARPVVRVLDGVNEAMVVLVHVTMQLAPFGVAALLFKVAGTTGLSVLAALGVYCGVVLLGLFLHMVLVYGSLVTFGAKLPFIGFLGAIRPALVVAFSTSSSSATLPITKECVEENLGVSNATSSFVLPLGATVNMDGTALYQGVAALFIAQIYGMDLSFGQQLTIVGTATLASVGAAGVPGAGMITLTMVLTAIGVPVEGLALVLGVDRMLDMFRTTINVIGDSAASAWIARLEGEPIRVLSAAEDAADPDHGFAGRLDHPARPVAVDQDER
jgi:proton glutamate symport protein